MGLMSAAEYAKLPSSVDAEKKALAYQSGGKSGGTGYSQAVSKFSEFGGASTVGARKVARQNGEEDNWRAYMPGGAMYGKPVGQTAQPIIANNSVPTPPAVDYAKQLQDALAQQQAAQRAAEQAAAVKKQQYIDTQMPLYDQYFNNQQNSQLTALKNARDTALQGYNSAETVANQNAYNNSNQVDAQHMQSAQRLKEIMAANGLLSSGDNVTQNVQLENQRQNSLYDINQAKGNILQDVAQKRNLTNNQTASQQQALIDQISADKTKALIDLQQYGDQKQTDLEKFNYQQYADSANRAMQQHAGDLQSQLAIAQLTGKYNGQDTLAAINASRQDALARAGLTGLLDGQSTLAGRGMAFDQSMGIADRTGQMPSGMRTLAAQSLDRQNKNDNISLAQWLTQTYGINAAPKSDAGVAFDQVNGVNPLAARQLNLDAALKLGQQDGRSYDPKNDWGLIRDSNAPLNLDGAKLQQGAQQFAQQMGLDWTKLNQQQQNMLMDNAAQMAGIGLQREKFNYDKDPNNIDNQLKQANIEKLRNGGNTMTPNQFEAEAVTNLKSMTPDMRKRFFDAEQGTIVNSLGVTGYNRLYNQYFDQYGNPK